MFDWRSVVAIIGLLLSLIAFQRYLRDIFRKKTKPHMYTFLIWTITQSIGVSAYVLGGGGIGILSLAVGTFFVFGIFLLSFKYGTKDITKSDGVTLFFAFVATGFWFLLDNPIAAMLLVTLIDGAGYIPTFRKTFKDPTSETVSTWFIFGIGNMLVLITSLEFNLLTMSYAGVLGIANFIIVGICITQRKKKKN